MSAGCLADWTIRVTIKCFSSSRVLEHELVAFDRLDEYSTTAKCRYFLKKQSVLKPSPPTVSTLGRIMRQRCQSWFGTPPQPGLEQLNEEPTGALIGWQRPCRGPDKLRDSSGSHEHISHKQKSYIEPNANSEREGCTGEVIGPKS